MGRDTSQLGKDKNASESHGASYRGVTLRNTARAGRRLQPE